MPFSTQITAVAKQKISAMRQAGRQRQLASERIKVKDQQGNKTSSHQSSPPRQSNTYIIYSYNLNFATSQVAEDWFATVS
jgi:hypothetical protein